MSTTQKALLAYRHALKATKVAFNGDIAILNASRAEIKKGFYQPDESKSVEERIAHLEGVSQFLLSNIVQGQRQDNGKFHLNIHEHTELGDNDSIKNPPKPTMMAGRGTRGGCCGAGQRVLKEKTA